VAYHNACLALLLRISQSRAGAILVFNAGIFPAVEESEIFMVDPDVGLGMEDAESSHTFFNLALSLMRIINSVALKYQSDQTVKSGRAFLSKSRACVTGILKRYAGVSAAGPPGMDLSDLVDNITLLISATDFLEASRIPRLFKLTIAV
jgi:nuclear pore complex protein Nup205